MLKQNITLMSGIYFFNLKKKYITSEDTSKEITHKNKQSTPNIYFLYFIMYGKLSVILLSNKSICMVMLFISKNIQRRKYKTLHNCVAAKMIESNN